jgi:cardiolipin synthase
MANKHPQSWRYGILGALLGLHVSCSGTSSNVRMEQTSTGITTSGSVAMVAVRATVLSAVRQPVTTTKLGLVVAWQRPREVVSANTPAGFDVQSMSLEAPGTPEFEDLLDRLDFPPAETGRLTWLVDGAAFFGELDRQIAAARHSIDIQIFIFDNDDIGVRYADRLKHRSTGIKVHVLFDDLGSTLAHASAPDTLGPRGFVPPPDMGAYLRKDSKIRARRTLNPWLVCDHTKLLVFDHQVAILGGMNIGREYYSEWHDLMVRVEGPIVQSLARDFNQAWRKAGPWGDLALLNTRAAHRPQTPPLIGGIPLRILRTDPVKGRYEILDATLLAIRGARKRIWIQNPYFAHDDLALAVESAARRGVDVRVIIPERGDSSLMGAGNLSTARGLILAGAKVFIYPKMTHLKVMICDDWASVGSANLDTLSMRINRELNLVFSDRAAVQELETNVFLPDFSRSRRVLPHETEGIANSLAETVADQL